MQDILKAVGKWLALVVVLVAVQLGAALGFMYTQVNVGDLPAYAVTFGGGELPQTGYQQFLNELRQTVPVVNAVGFRDTDGTWVRRRSQLSAGAQAALKEYEMLQYNVIFDKTDATADFFTLPTREEAG